MLVHIRQPAFGRKMLYCGSFTNYQGMNSLTMVFFQVKYVATVNFSKIK